MQVLELNMHLTFFNFLLIRDGASIWDLGKQNKKFRGKIRK